VLFSYLDIEISYCEIWEMVISEAFWYFANLFRGLCVEHLRTVYLIVLSLESEALVLWYSFRDMLCVEYLRGMAVHVTFSGF
jgi:hypothetical protein